MTMTGLTKRKSEAGFTLVELAIVMIIIGLLIGGILKGQELVANAQVTATIAQIKGIDGALSTFRDKYSALPGDMVDPNVRLRDCADDCDTDGDRNGRIDEPALGEAPDGDEEGLVAFRHMAAADLITGVRIDGGVFFGEALPEAKMGGGFWLGYTADGTAEGIDPAEVMRAGHYLVFSGLVEDVGSDGGITAAQAGQVDRKMDDGDPVGGSTRAPNLTECRVGEVYNEADDGSSCSLYIRVQG